MNWFMKYKKDNHDALKEVAGLSQIERVLLANRDIASADEAERFLNPILENMHDPFLFKDMHKAIDLIMEVLSSEESIRIVGDYDQDGVAATTILVRGLRQFAEEVGRDPMAAVDYAIPDRIEDGYGINEKIIKEAADDGVGLIITCDNGISAHEAVAYGKELGLSIIITDHHQVTHENGEEKLPPADAILNPHSENSGYPFADLCGAGVAYKLIQAFAFSIGVTAEETLPLMQFAALGTICDVVPLIGENRIIAKLGLDELNARPNQGVQLLLDLNNWEKEVSVYTVGFIIGPCINASGRLFTARLGVELFLEEDYDTALAYAEELVTLNEERKELTKLGTELAFTEADKYQDSNILLLYIPEAHESICGLIAGRLKEKFYKPTLVFTDASDENNQEILKGSGRSIEAYNMFEELDPHRDRFISFGGHAMACGLSIPKEILDGLRVLLNQEEQLSAQDLTPSVDFDLPLDFDRLDMFLLKSLDRFAPFGKDNPTPSFAAKFCNVRQLRLVGKNKNVLQIALEQKGRRFQAVLFQGDEKLEELIAEDNTGAVEGLLQGRDSGLQFDIVYRPEINEFRGNTSIQLKLIDVRLSKR